MSLHEDFYNFLLLPCLLLFSTSNLSGPQKSPHELEKSTKRTLTKTSFHSMPNSHIQSNQANSLEPLFSSFQLRVLVLSRKRTEKDCPRQSHTPTEAAHCIYSFIRFFGTPPHQLTSIELNVNAGSFGEIVCMSGKIVHKLVGIECRRQVPRHLLLLLPKNMRIHSKKGSLLSASDIIGGKVWTGKLELA